LGATHRFISERILDMLATVPGTWANTPLWCSALTDT
jgi:hypothetical protein